VSAVRKYLFYFSFAWYVYNKRTETWKIGHFEQKRTYFYRHMALFKIFNDFNSQTVYYTYVTNKKRTKSVRVMSYFSRFQPEEFKTMSDCPPGCTLSYNQLLVISDDSFLWSVFASFQSECAGWCSGGVIRTALAYSLPQHATHTHATGHYWWEGLS